MEEPSQELPEDPTLVLFVTAPLDAIRGTTANRAYRAIQEWRKRAFLHSYLETTLSDRYLFVQGELNRSECEQNMLDLHEALLKIKVYECSGPLLVSVSGVNVLGNYVLGMPDLPEQRQITYIGLRGDVVSQGIEDDVCNSG